MRAPRWTYIIALTALCGVGGYVLFRTAAVTPDAPKPSSVAAHRGEEFDAPLPTFRSGDRAKLSGDTEAASKGALMGQRSITFSSRAEMEKFLEEMKGKGIAVIGRLDALNTLHIAFLNKDELAGLLDGTEKLGFIFPVLVPNLPEGSVQAGAVPLGTHLADYLGVADYDRSQWGKGVKVAVLDTGVSTLVSFNGQVTRINLVALPGDLSTLNSHGTAVSSLILQVAPDAQILSIRIADEMGQSNSGLIAQGILEAVASGANVINISLGGFGDSQVLRDAVAYAQSQGVVIVASAGNNGVTQITQPASIPGVIAVAATSGTKDIMQFSNSGDNQGVAAPGYGVIAEGTDGGALSFSGTSASSPIEAGAIAAAMSNDVIGNRTAAAASELVTNSLDEAGAPGNDASYGGGTVNLERVMQSTTSGVVDAAVASQWVASNESGSFLQVTVENRGTTSLFNVPVTVTTSAGVKTFYAGSLAPNQTQTFDLPISLNGTSTSFQSSVTVPSGQKDSNLSNNSRKDVYTPASAE